MAADTYKTVAAPLRHEGEKIKGSRFIATVEPIASAAEVPTRVERLRGEFPAANHHCYAYRLRPGAENFRFSDDGEPSGSAGRPILQQIDGRGLTDVAVIVTRIFGGTKLGVGGLVRAYGGAAAEALALASIREVVLVRRVRLAFGYDLTGPVQGMLTEAGLSPVESSYGESVVLVLEVPLALADGFLARLSERTSGRVTVTEAAKP